jgi:lysophospholipase L1-like esterase
MLKTFAITVDLETQTAYNKFSVSQGDLNSIALTLNLTQDTKPVNLTDCEVRMVVKKPSGKTIIKDCPVIVPENGSCSVLLGTQASVEIGTYTAELYIYKNDSVAVSGVFTYSSRETILDDEHVESQNDWQAIHTAIGEAREILDYLEMNGTGIDSEAREDIKDSNKKINDIDTLKIDKNGSGQVSYSNLSQEVREKITGGSVAVVGDNSVVTTNITDNAVTPQKVSFLVHDSDTNYIDKSTVKNSVYINGGVDGQEKAVSDTTFYVTDFIPISPEGVYYFSDLYRGYYAFYDIDKNYISGKGIVLSGDTEYLTSPFTTPTGAYFARFTITGGSTKMLSSWLFHKNEKPKSYASKGSNTTLGELEEAQVEAISKGLLDNYVTTENKTSFLSLTSSGNLVDKELLKANSYINSSGSLVTGTGGDGTDGLYATDYIPLQPNVSYYYSQLYQGYYAFYDENKVFISGKGFHSSGDTDGLKNPFTIPQNAKYGRFTIGQGYDPNTVWINTENKAPKDYAIYQITDNVVIPTSSVVDKNNVPTEYSGDDASIFNKLIAIGDSLTEGTFNIRGGDINYVSYDHYSFPTYLEKMTGIVTDNFGRGGRTTKQWYEIYSNTDLSGYDCAIVQLGVNDVIQGSTTEETLSYLDLIVSKLKADNKGIKIFVSTIIPATSYTGSGYDTLSQAIREWIVGAEDVYLTDLAYYGHTKEEEAYNNGHLSAYGYWQLAKDYKAYIGYIVSSNKLSFRNVQFVGTDYTY